MKRRRSLRAQLITGFLVVILGSYAAALWFIPRLIVQTLQAQFHGSLTIGHSWVRFPLTLVLSGLRINSSQSLFTCRAASIRPWWVSWRSRTVWLKSVELEEPIVRFHRTPDGTWLVPSIASSDSTSTPALGAAMGDWRLIIETVNMLDATVELTDENLPAPFRGALRRLSFEGGPVTLPIQAERIALAVHGELVGDRGYSAPSYCSGWIIPIVKNLELSCRIEPLRLSAFEPYYHRDRSPLQVRVYDATLQATSTFTAKANDLTGRIQLTLGNLSEADLSVLGRTVIDAKELPETENRELSGEIKLTGPLDDPKQWRSEFVPGNEIVQRLIEPLLERGRESIPIKVGDQTVTVGITSATEEAMSSIEEGSKQVEETLKILSSPTPAEPARPEATSPAAEAPTTPIEGSTPAAASSPSPTGAVTPTASEPASASVPPKASGEPQPPSATNGGAPPSARAEPPPPKPTPAPQQTQTP